MKDSHHPLNSGELAPGGPASEPEVRSGPAPWKPETSLLDLVSLRPDGDPGSPPGTVLSGHLAGVDEEGRLQFQPEGHGGEPWPVAIGLELSDGALVKAVRHRRRGLIVRTADPAPRWVLVGLVRERVGGKARDAGPGRLEVIVDGETLQLNAERQIELKCGKASLLLRQDGRVVLSGTYVVSTSRGPNKIKGATIALN